MKTGILVEMSNVDELADGVLKLLKNSQLASKMGREGQKKSTKVL